MPPRSESARAFALSVNQYGVVPWEITGRLQSGEESDEIRFKRSAVLFALEALSLTSNPAHARAGATGIRSTQNRNERAEARLPAPQPECERC